MLHIQTERATASVSIALAPPLFDWHNIPKRFFETVYRALTPEIVVSADHFSVANSNSLDGVSVSYRIFGGPSVVTLTAEKPVIDFLDLLLKDYPLAARITESIERSFTADCPECEYSWIRISLYEHASIRSGASATEYLRRYSIPSVDHAFGESGEIQSPAGLFSVADRDAKWQARCTVEHSELLENGLFLQRDVTILNGNWEDGAESAIGQFWPILDACGSALNLEMEHGR